jgi:hypothetical protein
VFQQDDPPFFSHYLYESSATRSLPTYIAIVADCAKSSCRLHTDKAFFHMQKAGVLPFPLDREHYCQYCSIQETSLPSCWESNPGQLSPKAPSCRLSISLDISLQNPAAPQFFWPVLCFCKSPNIRPFAQL